MAVQIDDVLYAGTATSLSDLSLFKTVVGTTVNEFKIAYYSTLSDKDYIEGRTVLSAAATIYGVAYNPSDPELYIQSKDDLTNFLGAEIVIGGGEDYSSNINTTLVDHGDAIDIKCALVDVRSASTATTYPGFKLGITDTGGSWTSDVIPSTLTNFNTLSFDACAWNGENSTELTITIIGGGTFISDSSTSKTITLTPNTGASGSSPFTIDYSNDQKYNYYINGLTASSTIKFETTNERAIITAIVLSLNI